jgi:uncharacterized repeat protein (TIGR04052 family)
VSQRLLLTLSCVLLCSGCSEQHQELEIPFAAEFGGLAASCGPVESEPVLSDLRFYVSSPAVFNDRGRAVPVELVTDGLWQQSDIALLDLENGMESCENGTAELNTTLRILIPEGRFRGLQFTLGVPFDRNHADPLKAAAPLGDAAMHWHWRSGYKFLRSGMMSANDGFWIHVGSTACEGTVHNITGCNRPNRMTVSLPDFEPGSDTVVIDLAELLADTDLTDGVRSDCSSGPAETSCDAPFRALGIDFGSGSDIGTQRVFTRGAGR